MAAFFGELLVLIGWSIGIAGARLVRDRTEFPYPLI